MNPVNDKTTRLGVLIHRREHCLRVLANGSFSKSALVDHLDVPRSTLDNIVQELNEAGLVEYENGLWRATVHGKCCLEIFDRYSTRLEQLIELRELTSSVPSTFGISTDFLIDSTRHLSRPKMSDSEMDVLLDSLANSKEVRLYTPVLLAAYVEPIFERATEGSGELELTIPRDLFHTLEQIRSGPLERLDADISIRTGHVSVQFGLWISDRDEAGVIIYNQNRIAGVIVNDTATALGWALDRYDRIRDDTTEAISTSPELE